MVEKVIARLFCVEKKYWPDHYGPSWVVPKAIWL